MANETQTSNMILLAAAVESEMTPMFTPAAVMLGLVNPFNLGVPNAKALDLPVSGNVTASVVSESGAITPATITDTKVTLTIKKAVVSIKPSLETLRFTQAGNFDRFTRMSVQACIKKFEQDALALATGFSQSVDSGVALTVAKTIEAAYLVKAGNFPSAAFYDAVISYGASQDVANDIRTQTGAFYGNPNFNAFAKPGANNLGAGFMGQFFGINWWETGNHSTSVGNDDMMVINRDFALAALYPNGNAPEFQVDVSEHADFLNGNVILRVIMWYQVAEYIDAAGVWLKADT